MEAVVISWVNRDAGTTVKRGPLSAQAVIKVVLNGFKQMPFPIFIRRASAVEADYLDFLLRAVYALFAFFLQQTPFFLLGALLWWF